ncbi:trk system potassium uptake protein TrkH [Gemmobacter caeni]|uniref:Trk system potassium uptake protein n=2 Tax=Gemmobacter TaxID=204456 RepID=A0A2T6BBP0_9RHOB|nr:MULTISPECIES: TrkH family potassium uptake protein [Gemmobacter]OJY27427.1 MAG: potassium transporter TrkH [Rhodobacterales bacterium 65-51]PTX53500.1 trk system potassium uptake protein TrkH [Gemmobacter caeni]TWJ05611.1 trk system potassium uptake protein TrkH [Gemmobacter caeni]
MIDLTPAASILGRLLFILGSLMLIPALLDGAMDNGNAGAFVEAAIITAGTGMLVAMATRAGLNRGFDTRSAFLLTLGIWVVLPMFAALPMMTGAPGLSFTDAYFEAVSGITTTGSSVIIGLADQPQGLNLWRGMLNWLGGLGIAFIAMIFLPVMRVGGMQFFKTEGFDTLGKVLPRASDIALSLLGVYAGLTLACLVVYLGVGMAPLDAVVHAFATIATGGFSPQDASFGAYPGLPEYAGALFMVLAALPYIRYVQMVTGRHGALWRDPQARAFVIWLAVAVLILTLWRVLTEGGDPEPIFRDVLFNATSIMTGTGFFAGTFSNWGGFVLVAAFILGVIGGCSGSSSGALTVFRVQLSVRAVIAQLRQIDMPDRIAAVRYDGRRVDTETMNGVMMFVTSYILIIGVLSAALTFTGVDMQSALFAVWTSIGNIGYGIGPLVAGTGTFIEFPTAAKWILIAAMLLGRLSLLAFLVVLMPRFWRD